MRARVGWIARPCGHAGGSLTTHPHDHDTTAPQLTDIFYQIDLLLGPVLVILITWSFTFLAVALAEKQDALTLLKKRNVQLLVQGRELNAAKLEAQVRPSFSIVFLVRFGSWGGM